MVLRSPLTRRFQFEGKSQVRAVLKVALAELSDLRYHADIGDDRNWVLRHTAMVGGQLVEETSWIRLDEQRKIAEITLSVRPLPGLIALMTTMAGPIARELGKPRWVATLLSATTRPLALITRLGDRHLVSLAAPTTHDTGQATVAVQRRVVIARPVDEALEFVMDIERYQHVDTKIKPVERVRRTATGTEFFFRPRLGGIRVPGPQRAQSPAGRGPRAPLLRPRNDPWHPDRRGPGGRVPHPLGAHLPARGRARLNPTGSVDARQLVQHGAQSRQLLIRRRVMP